MKPFQNAMVAKVFGDYPPRCRKKLLAMREAIFHVAESIDGVGQIEETLKWGEPAYITAETRSGSTIRIGWKKATPSQCAMYFTCSTDLVVRFRARFPRDFKYEGNRAILFGEKDEIPSDALAFCIGAALTYRRDRKAKRSSMPHRV